MTEAEQALKMAVISLWNIYPDDFNEEFSLKEMERYSEDTKHLVGKEVRIEEVLHSAIQNLENNDN